MSIDARNPMMYKRLAQVDGLCVLSVSTHVLELQGVAISDQNAASDYVRFYPPAAIRRLNFNWIFADDWRHPDDRIAYWRHKSAKCAEVLVPHAVPFEYVQKGYVASEPARSRLLSAGFPRPVELMSRLFFR